MAFEVLTNLETITVMENAKANAEGVFAKTVTSLQTCTLRGDPEYSTVHVYAVYALLKGSIYTMNSEFSFGSSK